MHSSSYLEGQLLIAMPGIGDPRFERSVIFMCAHREDGAMGLIINKQADDITFEGLLAQMSIPIEVNGNGLHNVRIHLGGPVETGRGFVLHSTDYNARDNTMAISDRIALTASADVLRAIASGDGPESAILALGYAGWGPGQLEDEIRRNGWLNCDADTDLIFDGTMDEKYDRALGKIGISPAQLSGVAGHA